MTNFGRNGITCWPELLVIFGGKGTRFNLFLALYQLLFAVMIKPVVYLQVYTIESSTAGPQKQNACKPCEVLIISRFDT